MVLLSNYPADPTQRYLDWLQARTHAELGVRSFTLSSPMHFGEIYQAAWQVLYELMVGTPPVPALPFI